MAAVVCLSICISMQLHILTASLSFSTIECKRVFEQSCRLAHLSVCVLVGRSARLVNLWKKRLIGSGYRLGWWVGWVRGRVY